MYNKINELNIWESEEYYLYIGENVLSMNKKTKKVEKIDYKDINKFDEIKKAKKDPYGIVKRFWVWDYYEVTDYISEINDFPDSDEIYYKTGDILISEVENGIKITYNKNYGQACLFIKELKLNRVDFYITNEHLYDWISLLIFLKNKNEIQIKLDKERIRGVKFLF